MVLYGVYSAISGRGCPTRALCGGGSVCLFPHSAPHLQASGRQGESCCYSTEYTVPICTQSCHPRSSSCSLHSARSTLNTRQAPSSPPPGSHRRCRAVEPVVIAHCQLRQSSAELSAVSVAVADDNACAVNCVLYCVASQEVSRAGHGFVSIGRQTGEKPSAQRHPSPVAIAHGIPGVVPLIERVRSSTGAILASSCCGSTMP